MAKDVSKVIEAVKALGYKTGKCVVRLISTGRYEVTVGDMWLGIYDTVRNTFVD